jgi:hypothetical protein
MKHTPQILKEARPTELHLRAITGGRSKSPLLDDNLHNRPLHSSLRKVNRDLFRMEARRHFVEEALLFAAIVLVSTWPIVSLLHALERSIK